MPLSAKQMEYLAITWQCFIEEPKVNYQKFADLAGLASANSAREILRVTKNKLRDEYGTKDANSVPGTPKSAKKGAAMTPVSGTKGKAKSKAAVKNEDQDGDADGVSGSVTQNGKKRGRKPVKKEVGSGDEDEVETPSKKMKMKSVGKNVDGVQPGDAANGLGFGADDGDEDADADADGEVVDGDLGWGGDMFAI